MKRIIAAVDFSDSTNDVLNMAKKMGGPELTSFELMIDICLDIIFRHHESCTDPLENRYPWNVLIEISSLDPITESKNLVSNKAKLGHTI